MSPFKYSGFLHQLLFSSQVPSDDKVKQITSYRKDLDGTSEVKLQNSSFNYLIIITIGLKATFLCIIIKLITTLSCFDVGRSYLSFNACYLLFHELS